MLCLDIILPQPLIALQYSGSGTFAIPSSMAVNRGQNGIQQLLASEQEAQHIVNAARNCNCTFYCFLLYELFPCYLVGNIRIIPYYVIILWSYAIY